MRKNISTLMQQILMSGWVQILKFSAEDRRPHRTLPKAVELYWITWF